MPEDLVFSDTKFIGDVQVTKRISEAHVEEALVGFYEGGFSTWACMKRGQVWELDRPATEPRACWATKKLLEGGAVLFTEEFGELGGDDEERRWYLTLDKLLKGFGMWAQNPDVDFENMDAVSHDRIMQYALIGEIEFG